MKISEARFVKLFEDYVMPIDVICDHCGTTNVLFKINKNKEWVYEKGSIKKDKPKNIILKEHNKDLDKVLDFVERYNKQDKELDVAEAAARLQEDCHE